MIATLSISSRGTQSALSSFEIHSAYFFVKPVIDLYTTMALMHRSSLCSTSMLSLRAAFEYV